MTVGMEEYEEQELFVAREVLILRLKLLLQADYEDCLESMWTLTVMVELEEYEMEEYDLGNQEMEEEDMFGLSSVMVKEQEEEARRAVDALLEDDLKDGGALTGEDVLTGPGLAQGSRAGLSSSPRVGVHSSGQALDVGGALTKEVHQGLNRTAVVPVVAPELYR